MQQKQLIREEEEAKRRERSAEFDRAMRMAESSNEFVRKKGEELLMLLTAQ